MATQPQKNEEKVEEEKNTNSYSTFTGNRGWLYGLLALIAAVLIFMAGAGLADHHQGMIYRSGNIVKGPGAPSGFREHGFMPGGGFGGGNATVNGQSRDEGVVTAVNGNSFTLAGQGAATSVTTNSSTQYQGGNTVKQNDTVVVYGTESNGILTASRVIINP